MPHYDRVSWCLCISCISISLEDPEVCRYLSKFAALRFYILLLQYL